VEGIRTLNEADLYEKISLKQSLKAEKVLKFKDEQFELLKNLDNDEFYKNLA